MEQIFNYSILIIPFIILFVVMYFLQIRPEKRRRAQQFSFQSNLKKGDKVVSIGGIYGIIETLSEESVILTLTGGAKLKLERRAISRVTQENNN